MNNSDEKINLDELRANPELIDLFLKSDKYKNLPFHVRTMIKIQLGLLDPNNN